MNSTERKSLKSQPFCPPIPEGYRELKAGEIIRLGDCFYSPAKKNSDKTPSKCYISGSVGYEYKTKAFEQRTKLLDGQTWVVFRPIK